MEQVEIIQRQLSSVIPEWNSASHLKVFPTSPFMPSPYEIRRMKVRQTFDAPALTKAYVELHYDYVQGDKEVRMNHRVNALQMLRDFEKWYELFQTTLHFKPQKSKQALSLLLDTIVIAGVPYYFGITPKQVPII